MRSMCFKPFEPAWNTSTQDYKVVSKLLNLLEPLADWVNKDYSMNSKFVEGFDLLEPLLHWVDKEYMLVSHEFDVFQKFQTTLRPAL